MLSPVIVIRRLAIETAPLCAGNTVRGSRRRVCVVEASCSLRRLVLWPVLCLSPPLWQPTTIENTRLSKPSSCQAPVALGMPSVSSSGVGE